MLLYIRYVTMLDLYCTQNFMDVLYVAKNEIVADRGKNSNIEIVQDHLLPISSSLCFATQHQVQIQGAKIQYNVYCMGSVSGI